MKLQMRTGRQTHTQKQLELFSWADTRPETGVKAGYYGNGYRQRPHNDDCPFSRARGYIPPYGSSSANYPK